jgi:hypothetical protein
MLSYVVAEDGKAACGQYHGANPATPSDIVSEGVVIDANPGVDPRSLTRRGDQLAWTNSGNERTATIPR